LRKNNSLLYGGESFITNKVFHKAITELKEVARDLALYTKKLENFIAALETENPEGSDYYKNYLGCHLCFSESLVKTFNSIQPKEEAALNKLLTAMKEEEP